jgi:hypothetical protein
MESINEEYLEILERALGFRVYMMSIYVFFCFFLVAVWKSRDGRVLV